MVQIIINAIEMEMAENERANQTASLCYCLIGDVRTVMPSKIEF